MNEYNEYLAKIIGSFLAFFSLHKVLNKNLEKRLKKVEEEYVSMQILDIKQQACKAEINGKLSSVKSIEESIKDLKAEAKEDRQNNNQHFETITKTLIKVATKLNVEID